MLIIRSGKSYKKVNEVIIMARVACFASPTYYIISLAEKNATLLKIMMAACPPFQLLQNKYVYPTLRNQPTWEFGEILIC